MSYKHVVIGGGIAGVTCTETLSSLCPDEEILLVTASKLIKAITNYQKVSKTLEQFDVEERHMSTLETGCPNVKVMHKMLTSLDTDKHTVTLADDTVIQYSLLCICTGGKPKVISQGNPYVLGIRDTESVQDFQKRLRKARRIIVVGNGGIATELVCEVEGCEVIWAIKHSSVTSTFIDPGAAAFCLPRLNEVKPAADKPLKRLKYTEQDAEPKNKQGSPIPSGSALGPDWICDMEMKGSDQGGHRVHVEYKVEVSRILSKEDFLSCGKPETQQPTLSNIYTDWPVFVELTNGTIYGCDFVVSATGVVPNIQLFHANNFDLADDGGIRVNEKMQTSLTDVYAAGDVCNASWEHAPHWTQQHFEDLATNKLVFLKLLFMRLWSQARQMAAYAAKCMVAYTQQEVIPLDICFELFAHVTKFFHYKVILLGVFNAQGLGTDHELLVRVTKGQEYVKVVLRDGRMQGAILIGETDLEETFENLILNGTDLTPFKEHLLDPNIDIEDFFD